jgi:hypothetical protein
MKSEGFGNRNGHRFDERIRNYYYEDDAPIQSIGAKARIVEAACESGDPRYFVLVAALAQRLNCEPSKVVALITAHAKRF